MGTYYTSLGISSGMIGAAIALCVIHDVQVNDLGLQGFPGIDVTHGQNGFRISLNFRGGAEQGFVLTEAEAKEAVKKMKKGNYDPGVFDRVQSALANLEGER